MDPRSRQLLPRHLFKTVLVCSRAWSIAIAGKFPQDFYTTKFPLWNSLATFGWCFSWISISLRWMESQQRALLKWLLEKKFGISPERPHSKLASLNDRINDSIVSSMARMRYGGLTSCYHLENGGHFDDLSRGALQYQMDTGVRLTLPKTGAFGENTVSKMRCHWVRSQIYVQN